MYMRDLPPGIHDWEVDRQFGDVNYGLPKAEIDRRLKEGKEKKYSEGFMRVWTGLNVIPN